ncbi:MAG: universal stress protein [Candidatus Nitrosopelagicus sp.]|nr:universal stress protein [Candidatus Nitrosopelagicus sp.]MBT4455246.1 universal stress protein [Candidatus Nitrosopelagicus sp.]MBT7253330.1 universal stress protein [Candidatus Nitrosopelagicus sp.]
MATSVKKILVPLDNSKNSFRGLSSAIYFAKMCDAKIVAVHSVYAPPKGDFDTSGRFNKDHKRQVKSMMKIAEKQCENAGVEFVQKIIYGNPGYELAKFANSSKNKIDMVVIGSRGRSSAKELFFGSTSQFVLHKSKPPVLVIK